MRILRPSCLAVGIVLAAPSGSKGVLAVASATAVTTELTDPLPPVAWPPSLAWSSHLLAHVIFKWLTVHLFGRAASGRRCC